MAQSPDELMREYEQAANRHDLQATLDLIDEDAVYLFSDGSAHLGKGAVERAICRNFDAIQEEIYRIDNLTWLVKGEEIAACVYDFAWSGMINGQAAGGAGRGTSVLQRSGGGWKVVHEHLSKGGFKA
ncbi:MAG TPA: nuclear transport factor 2 family protein [Anaerolinea sp.]|nr:nuclear transport factor 2 family protein [Anaerolinea sp.]